LHGQAPEAQRRREGDTLHIQCPYAASTTGQQIKYWCLSRGNRGNQEVLYVRSYEETKQSQDGRIKIKDNKANKTVSVTMTGLKAEDSGTYFCAAYYSCSYGYEKLKTISLMVFRADILGVLQGPRGSQPRSQATSLCSGNTFLILSVVLLFLLLLALLTSTALAVRYYRLLLRTGTWGWECPRVFLFFSQPGRTGRRESSQDGSKGPAYINLDVQSRASPEDPLYCNVEPSQAPRNPQHVEYAIIAFNQSPRTSRE
ncbi:CLM7 protein, partial [Molothrus ater]|nr:CLM7 protein [Molothrus ater]